MRTAPPATSAVTECPRSRPSKISFNICLGLDGLSGVRDGGGAGRLAGRITSGLATSRAGWPDTASDFSFRRKKNQPAAIPTMNTIPVAAENASSRRFRARFEVASHRAISAGISTVGSPSSGFGVTLIGRAAVPQALARL